MPVGSSLPAPFFYGSEDGNYCYCLSYNYYYLPVFQACYFCLYCYSSSLLGLTINTIEHFIIIVNISCCRLVVVA